MRFIRSKDAFSRLSLSKTRVYELVGEGSMPKPIRLGHRASAWLESELDAMVAARAAGFDEEQLRSLVDRLHAQRKERAAALVVSA